MGHPRGSAGTTSLEPCPLCEEEPAITGWEAELVADQSSGLYVIEPCQNGFGWHLVEVGGD